MGYQIEDEVAITDAIGNIIHAESMITDIKEVEGKTVYRCSDGVWYNEEQLQPIRYQLTSGAVLGLWLRKYGYVTDETIWDKDGHTYTDEFNDLMNDMSKIGVVKWKENEDEEERDEE